MNQDEYKKIISFAVDQEIQAFTFYHSVAERAEDKNVKNLFSDLAADEKKHQVTLETFLDRAPEKLHFSEAKDYKVVDSLPTPPLSPDLKPLDGLIIAIRKELEAMQMYTQLAVRSTEATQKDIFLELASMERGHKNRLEDIYTNMAFPEVW